MSFCKICKKPLSSENEKYCAICYSKRSERSTKILKTLGEAAAAIIPIVIAIISRKPPKKL
jgi:hypothetical protein